MTLNGNSCNTIAGPAGAPTNAFVGGLMTMSLNNYAPRTYNVTVQWNLWLIAGKTASPCQASWQGSWQHGQSHG